MGGWLDVRGEGVKPNMGTGKKQKPQFRSRSGDAAIICPNIPLKVLGFLVVLICPDIPLKVYGLGLS